VNGYFITGTGTGVGKTHVTAAIARATRAAGLRVFAFKPIETGCSWVNGILVGADQTLLAEAAGNWQTGALRGVYQFEPPVAPLVASSIISLDRIHETLIEGSRDADLVLVEGAGGWRVPITSSDDMGSLAKRCGLSVIVVATSTLGTINHSLLTLEAVGRDGLEIAALILSHHPNDDLSAARTNASQISLRWPGKVVLFESDSDALSCVSRETPPNTFHVKHS
jgi:dethiobiotin synthetase